MTTFFYNLASRKYSYMTTFFESKIEASTTLNFPRYTCFIVHYFYLMRQIKVNKNAVAIFDHIYEIIQAWPFFHINPL